MNLKEYWDCTNKMLTWPDCDGPDILVDDGGDATLLIHEGVKAEKAFEKDGTVPDPNSTDNAEFKCVLSVLAECLKQDPKKWHKIAEGVAVAAAGGCLPVMVVRGAPQAMLPYARWLDWCAIAVLVSEETARAGMGRVLARLRAPTPPSQRARLAPRWGDEWQQRRYARRRWRCRR